MVFVFWYKTGLEAGLGLNSLGCLCNLSMCNRRAILIYAYTHFTLLNEMLFSFDLLPDARHLKAANLVFLRSHATEKEAAKVICSASNAVNSSSAEPFMVKLARCC